MAQSSSAGQKGDLTGGPELAPGLSPERNLRSAFGLQVSVEISLGSAHLLFPRPVFELRKCFSPSGYSSSSVTWQIAGEMSRTFDPRSVDLIARSLQYFLPSFVDLISPSTLTWPTSFCDDLRICALISSDHSRRNPTTPASTLPQSFSS